MMSKIRVIILISQSFNAYVASKIDIKRLLDEGFSVEIFDLSSFMMPDYPPVEYMHEDPRLVVTKLKRWSDLPSELRLRSPNAVLIDHGNQNPWVRSAVNASGIRIVRMLTGGLPVSGPLGGAGAMSLFSRLSKMARQAGVVPMFARIVTQLGRKAVLAWKKPTLDAVILGGERLLSNERAYLTSRTRIVNAHVHDVDVYRSSAMAEPAVGGDRDYVVFVDQDIPHHPDLSLTRMRHRDPEIYYQRLRDFFDRIETMGLEVVVSLHPRDNGKAVDERFGPRRTFKGRTASLVMGSRGILTHCSNAINFAVMARKPVIFVADRELLDIFFQIRVLCEWFSKEPIMLDESVSEKEVMAALKVDEEVYERYRRNFIQCGDGEGRDSLMDILVREVRRLSGPLETRGA